VRFSVPCSGKENGFAIQSIPEQATCFTFFEFSVENKTFPTKMTGEHDFEKMIRRGEEGA
jgi:hypothetical protein